MRRLFAIFLLLISAGFPAPPQTPQRDPIIKANWTLVTYTNAYAIFIDRSLIKETQQMTLVAFQLRIARSDTKEGQLAKQQDYVNISKIVGTVKAKAFSHEVSLVEVSCEEEKSRALKIWLDDKQSQTIYDFSDSQLETQKKWTRYVVNSIGSKVIKAVCDGTAPAPLSSQ